MSTPTFAIKLDTSTKLQGGYNPVVLQCIYQRKSRRIRLGIKAKPTQWEGDRLLNSANNGRRLNKQLDEKEELARKIYDKNFEGKWFDFRTFSHLFKKGSNSGDFYDISDACIATKKRAGTQKFYKDATTSMRKLRPVLDISQVTPKLLMEHEKVYGSAAYMRGIKTIVNYAITTGSLSLSNNPFKTRYNPIGYSFAHIKQKRKPVAFTEDEINAYLDVGDDTLYNDMALVSYYSFGTNMWDFLQWTDANEIDGAIHFTRSKTGVYVIIPITEPLRKLIDKYREGDRWFPLCDFSNERKAKKRVDNLRKKVSLKMKSICKFLGIKKSVSFYTMRHTAATIALKRGARIEEISALLGHKTIYITQVYLQQFTGKELTGTIALLHR